LQIPQGGPVSVGGVRADTPAQRGFPAQQRSRWVKDGSRVRPEAHVNNATGGRVSRGATNGYLTKRSSTRVTPLVPGGVTVRLSAGRTWVGRRSARRYAAGGRR